MRILFILFILFLSGCHSESVYPGFTETFSGLHYKRITIGEGKITPHKGDFVRVNCTLKSISGEFFKNEMVDGLLGVYNFQLKEITKGGFTEAITKLVAGDSALFIINYSKIVESVKTNFDVFEAENSVIDPDHAIVVELKLLECLSPDDYKKKKQDFIKWSNQEDQYEEKKLMQYLKDQNITNAMEQEGYYFISEKEGKGKNAELGNAVFIEFTGSFINGEEFDNTYKSRMPLDFILGQSDQVIKGIELALLKMKRGGKAKIILPSHLAWGDHGSSNGKIPPNTTVIFDIELKLLN